MNVTPEAPKGNHRYWRTTHQLFLERLKEINATRPADKPMKYIEFMHKVSQGRIKMKMGGTS